MPLDLSDRGISIVPWNINQERWVLLIANSPDRKLYVLDSIGEQTGRQATLVQLVQKRALPLFRVSSFGHGPQSLAYEYIKVQQQQNSDDCGICMLANISAIVQGQQLPVNANFDDYRCQLLR